MLYKKGRCKMNFVDSLIGFAIGDAVGVPVEFTSRETLKVNPTTDMEEYGTHYQPKGTWSDDTSMTIATVYSMIEKNTICCELTVSITILLHHPETILLSNRIWAEWVERCFLVLWNFINLSI